MEALVRFINRLPNLLRWILMLPAAFLGAGIVRTVMLFVTRISLRYATGGDTDSYLFFMADVIYDGIIFALAFLQIAYLFAPSHKVGVTIVMAVITNALSMLAAFKTGYDMFSKTGIIMIAFLFSSVYVCIKLINDPECMEIKE